MTVAGRPIGAAEVGAFVARWRPEAASEAMDRAVEEALVAADAAAESVRVPEALLSEATAGAIDERMRSIRLQYGPGADSEESLRSIFGRGRSGLRQDTEQAVRTALLRDRVVRLDQRRQDGADLRVLVLPSRLAADEAVDSLRRGADMALLAARIGVAAPAAPPPLVRSEIPDGPLRDRIFAASPGDILDPVPFETPDPAIPGVVRTSWQVFRVVSTWSAGSASWDSLAGEIEASVLRSPPTAPEIRRWRDRAWARHGRTSLPR